MATRDRRSDFFGLFTRSNRASKSSRAKSRSPSKGSGKITDPLGATRATTPHVVHPTPPKGSDARPALTVVPPPSRQERPKEPHIRAEGRRIRFALGYTASGTMLMALCMLLLLAFVLGMRYQESRPTPADADNSAVVVRNDDNTGGGVTPISTDGADRTGGDARRDTTGSGNDNTSPTPVAAGTKYHLRVVVLAASDRDGAQKAAATLQAKNVPVLIRERRIGGRPKLVVYSRQRFDSRTSADAEAFRRRVQMISVSGRLDFASAYFVVAED